MHTSRFTKGLATLRQLSRRRWLEVRHGIQIDPTASFDSSIHIVSGKRGTISIGAHAKLGFETLIIAVDRSNGQDYPVHIGARTIIGPRSTIMPDVKIGDDVVISPGSVVTHNMPDGVFASGCPAQVVAIESRQLANETGARRGVDIDFER